MSQPVFRFAPSPNGELHLGHARSALLNQKCAREAGGKLLLRIEDIDLERCTTVLEKQMLEDLEWLGFEWDGLIRRQSEHFDSYQEVLDNLEMEELVYPAVSSREEVRRKIVGFEEGGNIWPRDPDGVPHYPGEERMLNASQKQALKNKHGNFGLRLDMEGAKKHLSEIPGWQETGEGPEGQSGWIIEDPANWGDVVLGRKDVPTSYLLACVLDDALQGVTHIVRGQDLFHVTSVHRVLQELLGLPPPQYQHHALILGKDGRKLSKSSRDTSLRQLREVGLQPVDVARMAGVSE